MITFHGGPAHGKTLMIRRVPFFLRVVFTSEKIDALDQLGDVPEPEESILVYLRQPGAKANAVHLYVRVKGGSGWFATGSYKLSPAQPTDAEARDTDLWRAWCERLGKAQHEEPLPDSWADEGWLPMWTAPTRSKNVRVRTSDGTVHQPVYFAQDLSGEEQPPFSGWFEPQGKSYAGVVDVKAWMPLAATSAP